MSALAWSSPAHLLGGATECNLAGDMIRTGENRHPHYHVIAVTQDRAWIRDTQHGTDHIISIERCRKIHRA
jgi:hypothetical protein